jgi:hypothetical protein
MKERFATTSATGRIRLPESRREDPQLRVKTGKPQCEHLFSALPPEADIGVLKAALFHLVVADPVLVAYAIEGI